MMWMSIMDFKINVKDTRGLSMGKKGYKENEEDNQIKKVVT